MIEVARVGSYSFHLHAMMVRSAERCNLLADSERLLGYTDSSHVYKEMAGEVQSLALWAAQEERRMMVSESELSSDG